MAIKQEVKGSPGVILVVTYFVLFAVNSLVVYSASLVFPRQVVLGTGHISTGWALIHAVGTLALVNAFAIPFIHEQEEKRGMMFTFKEWMGVYFVLNFVGVWGVARFAEQLGFGISSWMVAFALGAVLSLAQGAVMMQVEKYRKENS